jgi:hypothetical protein
LVVRELNQVVAFVVENYIVVERQLSGGHTATHVCEARSVNRLMAPQVCDSIAVKGLMTTNV